MSCMFSFHDIYIYTHTHIYVYIPNNSSLFKMFSLLKALVHAYSYISYNYIRIINAKTNKLCEVCAKTNHKL